MNKNKLDWDKAKKHFDTIEQQYLDLRGLPGVDPEPALLAVFRPLARRYNNGERTPELHREMMSVE